MEISHFLANYVILAAILNFWTFSGIKRHHTWKRLTDSCSTSNLAIETSRFEKKLGYLPSPTWIITKDNPTINCKHVVAELGVLADR